MTTKKSLSKTKKTLLSRIAVISAVITLLTVAAMVEFNAAVSFSNGITEVANEVKSQARSAMTVIFGAVAIFALGFTLFKGIGAAFTYRRGEPVHIGPVIGGGIGTIVAGLCTSATIFGWFGL